MPTYEYLCDACGNKFEKFQSITSAPIKKCPKCGKSKVRRLIGTGAGLIFKGSGFYITDYRPESYEKAAKADAPGGGETKSDSGTASGDAKPAAGDKPANVDKPAAKAEPKAEAKPATKAAEKSSGGTKKSKK